jgi:hypothetical protein
MYVIEGTMKFIYGEPLAKVSEKYREEIFSAGT